MLKKKGFLFDLDGVLIDTHKFQNKSTLLALKNYITPEKKILNLIDQTIPTILKLKIIKKKYFNKKNFDIYEIYKKKINHYEKMTMKNLKPSSRISNIFKFLKKENLNSAIVTNSNRITAIKILKKIKILKYIDVLVTNNDLKRLKPYPDPYNLAVYRLGGKPKNYVIIEDSEIGIRAAKKSGCNYYKLKNFKSLDLKLINNLNKKYLK